MATLIQRAKRGEQEAFVELMELHKQAMYKVAAGCLGNPEDAADAMQDTVLSAWEHLDTLEQEQYFKTWLIRILIRKCQDILRRERRFPRAEEAADQGREDAGQERAEFIQLLEGLPENYRLIFLLYYGEGFRIREISQMLELKENTVKSRLRRGRDCLAAALRS